MISWLPMVLSFISKYKKYVAIAAAVVLVVVAVKMWTNSIYDRGYQAGIALLNEEKARYELAVVQWNNEIALRQVAHDEAVKQLMANYEAESTALDQEIDRLKSNPKIVYKYVAKDTKCAIPDGFVALHNTSAKGLEMADENQSQAVSDKTLSDVASVVADNYYQCNLTAARLKALQKVVTSYQNKQKELAK